MRTAENRHFLAIGRGCSAAQSQPIREHPRPLGRALRATAPRPVTMQGNVLPAMPLFTLDSVSVAFGHLPLLDRVAFQVDPGERVAVIGRNGTGKSTLLKIIAGELAAGRRHRLAPARRASSRASSRTCRSPTDQAGVRRRRRGPRRAERRGHRLPPRGARRRARRHARGPRAPRPSAARARRAGRLAGRGARRDGARSPRPAARRAGRHAVRRLAPARAAGARARRPAGRARCSTSRPTISTSTRSRGSKRSSLEYPGARRLRHPRSRVPRARSRRGSSSSIAGA